VTPVIPSGSSKAAVVVVPGKNKLKNKNKKNRPSNLFDIDNFIVSNICGSRKITDSKNAGENIVIPKYKKLGGTYYNAPSFKIQKYGEENLASDVIIVYYV
jgi:hypothetical protein